MLTLRGCQQLRTGRHLKSYRSCRTSTGFSASRAESRRRRLAEVATANRELRRQWLAQGWRWHDWQVREARRGAAGATP